MKKNLHYCILGLGITGISCLNFLITTEVNKITAVDIKKTKEFLELQDQYSTVHFILGEFKIPDDVDILVISPGIDPLLPVIQQALLRGVKITNDINIFLEHISILKRSKNIQIIAITGTNGKTTVVNILANMAKENGLSYALCGNVGAPVLDYLSKDVSLYILELSSFQLELLSHLPCKEIFEVACILNITPDHLDRYINFAAYCAAKLNIYQQAKNIVYYREDINTKPKQQGINNINSFGLSSVNNDEDFGIDIDNKYLIYGKQKLLLIKDLALFGEHNILNVLACFAIGKNLKFSIPSMINVLKCFSGLEHRCQTVGNFDGIYWINDSKGTNVGAAIAAINSVVKHYNTKLIIILGGISKNADLSLLQSCVINNCKAAIFIGSCKEELFNIFNDTLECYKSIDLKTAVYLAKKIANKGDVVLLSPACASFDMFENYKHRGEVFKNCVLELNNVNNNFI